MRVGEATYAYVRTAPFTREFISTPFVVSATTFARGIFFIVCGGLFQGPSLARFPQQLTGSMRAGDLGRKNWTAFCKMRTQIRTAFAGTKMFRDASTYLYVYLDYDNMTA